MANGDLKNTKGEVIEMIGAEQFLSLFGNVTVSTLVTIGFAAFFCWRIYLQIKKFIDNKKEILIKKHEAEKEKDEKIDRLLEEVNKYPQYREQSRKIQQEFREEIDGLKISQKELAKTQQSIQNTLTDMQEKRDIRERNKLRDKLLQSYRYYTDIQKNPNQSWTKMESEAFWALFRDYEDMGGDGYMHTVIQPAMNLLKVTDNF